MFTNSRIIFVPENMTALTHTQLAEAVADMTDVHTVHERGGVKKGVCKTEYITKEYVLKVQGMLEAGLIYLSKYWISVSAEKVYRDTLNAKESLLKEVFTQLCRVGMDEKKRKIDGKGKDGNLIDDLAVSFEMLCYWPSVIIHSTTVEHYMQLVRGVV